MSRYVVDGIWKNPPILSPCVGYSTESCTIVVGFEHIVVEFVSRQRAALEFQNGIMRRRNDERLSDSIVIDLIKAFEKIGPAIIKQKRSALAIQLGGPSVGLRVLGTIATRGPRSTGLSRVDT